MELIDRNAVLKTIPSEELVARMAVMSAPVVNAIPIEWIEDWLSDHSILWDTPSEIHIRQILMDWKAEQEGQHETIV